MSSIVVAGDTSGSITIAAPAVAGSGTLTLPTGTDTLIGKATTDTLTNKSIAATQLTGTIAAAALPAGSVLQVVNSISSAVDTTTVIIPRDNTIPQITEGGQFLSLAITPKSATSKLLIQGNLWWASSTGASTWTQVALFKVGTADALAANASFMLTSGGGGSSPINYFMTSGTTSSITFTVRAGMETAGTLTVNGSGGLTLFGGTYYSSITITEIAA
jgi:hypothetical protein